jgi:hypothetical protein
MLCFSKLTKKNALGVRVTFPCGMCAACRLNKINEWTGRGILEWTQPAKMFTLTLDDTKLEPVVRGKKLRPHDHDVSKVHAQEFLKRLRKNIQKIDPNHRIKYMMVAEYGKGKTKRAHYHGILFNFPQDFWSINHKGPFHKALEDAWPYGFVKCDELKSPGGIAYVVKYLFKQARGADSEYYDEENVPKDMPELIGRRNTFFLASRNPGIGHKRIDDILDSYVKYGIMDDFFDLGKDLQINPIKGLIRINRKKYYMGEYMVKKIRERALERKLTTLYETMKYADIWEMAEKEARLKNGLQKFGSEYKFYKELTTEEWEKARHHEKVAEGILRRKRML